MVNVGVKIISAWPYPLIYISSYGYYASMLAIEDDVPAEYAVPRFISFSATERSALLIMLYLVIDGGAAL
jgi:hypothetical protein